MHSSKNIQVAAMAQFSPENIDDIMAEEKALSMAQMLVNFPFKNRQEYSASLIAFKLQMGEGRFPELLARFFILMI
jgi:hypothetical protein